MNFPFKKRPKSYDPENPLGFMRYDPVSPDIHNQDLREKKKEVRSRIGAVLLAIAGATTFILPLKDCLTEGWNVSPRGPQSGVDLKDPELNTELKCLREAFNEAVMRRMIPNKWMKDNCDPDLLEELKKSDKSPLFLTWLTQQRDEVLKAAEIISDNEESPIKWKKSFGGQNEKAHFKTEIDMESLKRKLYDQKSRGMEPTFSFRSQNR